MNIPKEFLEAKQQELLAHQESLVGQANACNGALELVALLLETFSQKETKPKLFNVVEAQGVFGKGAKVEVVVEAVEPIQDLLADN